MKAFKSEFIKKLITLLSGGTLAQLIPLLLSPYIARNFSVENLAVHGLYFSLVSVFAVSITGKLEVAIIVPRSSRKAKQIFVAGFFICLFLSVVMLVLILIFGRELAMLLGSRNLQEYLIIVPFSVFVVGVYQLVSYWLIRKSKIKQLAGFKPSQRIAESISIVGTGFARIESGLIISDFIGRVAVMLYAIFSIRRLIATLFSISVRDFKQILREYKSYIIQLAPSSLANTLSMHLALFVVSSTYESEVTGQFNFVRMVVSLPLTFIGVSLSQVLLERLSKKSRNHQTIKRDVLMTTLGLICLGIAFTLPLFIFGETIFVFIFGDKWARAGKFSEIMVIAAAVRFVASPLSATLNAIDKIKPMSYWQWFYFGFILLLIPLSNFYSNPIDFLRVYVLIDICSYLLYWLVTYKFASAHDKAMLDK